MADIRANAAQFGAGIVEISAVATLIGGPVAEALTVGLKSAAGLPWASMSTFGLLHVAKSSLAAAVPDWIREALGLQNDHVEQAIGLCVALQKEKQARNRVDLRDVKGLSILYQEDEDTDTSIRGVTVKCSDQEEKCVVEQEHALVDDRRGAWFTNVRLTRKHSRHQNPSRPLSIYRLDRTSLLVLATVQESERGKSIPIHEFVPDLAGQPKLWKDWLTLATSLSKLAEVITLRLLGANSLYWLSALPWAYGICAALFLMATRSSRDHQTSLRSDMVAGSLPMPLHGGQAGTLVLGMPVNIRRFTRWRVVWWLYSLVSLTGLLGVFLVLGHNAGEIIYTWIGFQTLWMICRTLVFYLLEGAAGSRQSLVVERKWADCSYALRRRCMRLILTLAEQQNTLHPRGVEHYQQDLMDLSILIRRFQDAGWSLEDHLSFEHEPLLSKINIVDVVGDNLLRSVSWMSGGSLSNSELYDCALVFIRLGENTIAVPAVRVMTCRCQRERSRRWPRGDSHGEFCKNMDWIFWIPTHLGPGDETQYWLYVSGKGTKGVLSCTLLKADDLDERLAGHEWLISLRSIAEIHAIVQISRQAARLLMSFVLGLLPPQNKSDTSQQ
ncbi:hypothetical protein PV05_05044 [Exophiala xenobiotica]|uniref:Uncharacterized protein n=1 Tax=Exophiala xenobiotica TaxID=348802 RepID=A0A0D2F8L3_9EURO|nr:uncharacterized protein PV05_05044 [Exophiala xenobiotica]KIW56379.1 hypothetical protein PV05_05044 [Exophiala xenobiotica]